MNDPTLFERHSDAFISDIGLYYSGKRVSTKNHVYGPEIRSHYLLVYVEKGNAVLYRKRKSLSFGEGQMLVMFPGEKVFYKAQTEWTIRWIGISGKQIDNLFALLSVTPERPFWRPPENNNIADIMEKIYVAQDDNSVTAKYKTQSLLCKLFAYMLSTLEKTPAYSNAEDVISSIKSMIDYNYNNVSVSVLSEKACLTPEYFSRLFKEKTGLSPKQYILRIRLDKAKEMLVNTDYPIKNIAVTVGFKDPLYFSRIFVKREGVSPSEFRNAAINKQADLMSFPMSD